jgi:hypothetical protein
LKFIIILVDKSVHFAGISSQEARSCGDTSMTYFVFWCIVVLRTKSDDRNYETRESEHCQDIHPFEIYLEDWEIAFLIG